MTHAGVPPTWTKADLEINSNELSSKLLNHNSDSFLEEIFGNYPNHPKKCKNNTDQLRLNLNCLTRMRYYDITGSLNFEYKGTIEEAQKREERNLLSNIMFNIYFSQSKVDQLNKKSMRYKRMRLI